MNTLVLNYANPTATKDPYWVRIEQDKVDDAATVDQAADVLDALFQIEPCNREESEEPETTEPVDQEEAADTVADVLSLPACDMAFDGSLDTTIRIYRSHLSEPYTLRLQGGAEVETITESGPVKVTAEISETVTLDYPVVTGFYCSPAPVSRTGNTLRFEASLVGRQFSASYQSEWDKMTVRITGVDGEPGECTAIAFHHGVASALNLETPDIDEADLNLCPLSRWQIEPADYEVTCYKIIEVTQRCTCSGAEVGSYSTEQVVPCPNPDMRCPNNETTCMHLLGTEPLDEWVECEGDSEIPGRPGQRYAIATPSYYEEVCCTPPAVVLPQCPTKRTVYKAELPIEYGQAFWRGIYGEATRFKPVAPPAGICGEWIIEQSIQSPGCCDGVEPLGWDTSVSPETIAPSSAATIGVTGGRAPYTWTVSGVGFQFQSNGQTAIETSAPTVSLSALTTACGTAEITVTDGCSTVTGYIRSTSGVWVQIWVADGGIYGDADTDPFPGGCPISATGTAAAGVFASHIDEAIQGRYKVRQGHYFTAEPSGYNANRDAAIAYCNSQTYPPGVITPYQLDGFCFYYPPLCIGCDPICEGVDSFDYAAWVNRSPGKHAAITNYRYRCNVGWPVISFTIVYEWRCTT